MGSDKSETDFVHPCCILQNRVILYSVRAAWQEQWQDKTSRGQNRRQTDRQKQDSQESSRLPILGSLNSKSLPTVNPNVRWCWQAWLMYTSVAIRSINNHGALVTHYIDSATKFNYNLKEKLLNLVICVEYTIKTKLRHCY